MAFLKYADGTIVAAGARGIPATAVKRHKYPPGYQDPQGVLERQARYLVKWEIEGKRIDQWRRALALAIARHQYYKPHKPRGAGNIGVKIARQRRFMQTEKGKALVKRMLEVKAHNRNVRKRARELEKQGRPPMRSAQLPVG